MLRIRGGKGIWSNLSKLQNWVSVHLLQCLCTCEYKSVGPFCDVPLSLLWKINGVRCSLDQSFQGSLKAQRGKGWLPRSDQTSDGSGRIPVPTPSTGPRLWGQMTEGGKLISLFQHVTVQQKDLFLPSYWVYLGRFWQQQLFSLFLYRWRRNRLGSDMSDFLK